MLTDIKQIKDKKSRMSSIDVFRAIAIILVTTFHIARWSGIDQNSKLSFLLNGWVGVGLFFIISGYCMGMATRNSDGLTVSKYKNYIVKRVLRIAPSYYTAMIFWIAIILTTGRAYKPISADAIITHLLFIHNLFDAHIWGISGVFWSIAVEMQFYLFFPFFMLLLNSNTSFLITLPALVFITLLLNYLYANPVIHWSILAYLSFFLFGYFLYKNNEYLSTVLKKTKAEYALLVLAVALYFSKYGLDIHSFSSMVYEIVISITLSLIMICLPENVQNPMLRKINGGMSFIGKRSFSIYLYNYIFYVTTDFNTSKAMIIPSMIFVFAFGILMYEIFEKRYEVLRGSLLGHQK